MPADQFSLYGQPRSKQKTKNKNELPSTGNLAFTTQLSSLISQGQSQAPVSASSRGRPRPSKTTKTDLFAKPNKGTQKRAATDLDDNDDDHTKQAQKHQLSADIGGVDAAALKRSKLKMEEKVQLYEDMKKGLYLAAESSDEDEDETGPARHLQEGEDYLARLRRKEREGLVDFDRKWADEERVRRGGGSGDEHGSDQEEDDEDDDDDNASIISYEDELGRSRRGTRAAAARAAREKEKEASQDGVVAPERWQPARPDNLIYGATVQAQAFNPDARIAEQMSHLAARRDRSHTPPEQMHYDAEAEVRNRGTGFYAFSRDEAERKKQMDELMNIREETQREREARQALWTQRKLARSERRKQIQDLKAKRLAAKFLDSFEIPQAEDVA